MTLPLRRQTAYSKNCIQFRHEAGRLGRGKCTVIPGPGLRDEVAEAAASGANPVTPLSGEEIASWRAVGGELLPRLWQHLRRRAGAGFAGPDPGEVQG